MHYGRAWLSHLTDHSSLYAYSIRSDIKLTATLPLTYAYDVMLSLEGIKAKVVSPWGEGEFFYRS